MNAPLSDRDLFFLFVSLQFSLDKSNSPGSLYEKMKPFNISEPSFLAGVKGIRGKLENYLEGYLPEECQPKGTEDYYTIRKIAELEGLTLTTVYSCLRSGALKAEKVPGTTNRWRIPHQAYMEWKTNWRDKAINL